MIFNTKLTILSFVAIAAAQSSSSSSSASASGSGSTPVPSGFGITRCIIDCVTPAATAAGCSSFADLQCVCTSTQFQDAARNCLRANCTGSEVTTALGLQTSQCSALIGASGSSSASGSNTGSNTGGASATQTSPTTGSTSGSSSGAATSPSQTAAASSTAAGIWGLVAGMVGAAAAFAL